MLDRLPKGVKLFLCVFTSLLVLFIIFSASVAFLEFPFSAKEVLSSLNNLSFRKYGNNSPLPDKNSPFANIISEDIPPSIDEKIFDYFIQKISLESDIPNYNVKLTLEGQKELVSYFSLKEFFSENLIAKTLSREELESLRVNGQSFAPEFITAETLTIVLTDQLNSARIRSGSKIDMGLDYIATDEDVKILISVLPEDLNNNLEEVEKTFSALLYQGIHTATYAYHVKGRSPEEYSPVPDEFYTELESNIPLIKISKKPSLTGFLEKLGLLNKVYAYCAGHSVCFCEDDPDPDCREWGSCWWDSTWGACVNLSAGCALSGSNCYWVNPDPDPDPDPVCGCGDCNQACSGVSYTGLCEETCTGCRSCGNICDGGVRVSIYVYYDTNENGKWDDGEEGINLGSGDPRVAGAKLVWTSGSPCSSGNGSITENEYIVSSQESSEDCSDERDGVEATCRQCNGSCCVPAIIDSQSFGDSFNECTLINSDWCGPGVYLDGDFNNRISKDPDVYLGYVGNYWHRVLRDGGGNTFSFNLYMDDNPNYEATTGTVSRFLNHTRRHLIAFGIKCSPPPGCGELTPNQSNFECGESFGTWTFPEYAGTSSGTAEWSNEQYKEGSYSLKADYRGISSYYTAYTRVGSGPSVNKQARFSGWYKVTTKVGNPNLKICIQHREDGGGTYLGEDCFPLSSTIGGWTYFDVVSPNKGLLEDQTSLQFVSSGDDEDDRLVYYVDDLCLVYESSCSVPDCPTNLSVNLQCGATVSKATFSWQSIYDESLVLPSKWVLRVDYDDNIAPEWPNAHDYFRYATSSWIAPNDISSCVWDFGGAAPVLKCSATLDSTTLSRGGYPFTPGHYNWWSIQAVNDCDSYDGQCSVVAPAFDCINQAPTCTPIVGPSTILYGDSGIYESTLRDPIDPVQYRWWAHYYLPVSGFSWWSSWRLSPIEGSTTPPAAVVSTTYTPDPTGYYYENDSTVLWLDFTDTVLRGFCNTNVSFRYPRIVGKIYDATDNGCRGTLTALPYLVPGADLSFKVDGTTQNNISVDPSTGIYNFSPTTYVVGSSLESIYLSDIDGDRDIAPPPDTTLETECVETACTGTVGSLPADCSTVLNGLSVGPKLTTIGPYSIPGDVTINIGYKLTSSLKGWFTVRDGDIYSGSSFIMVPPQEPGSYDLYLTNSFALSSGTLDIKDSGGVERISDKGYGYAIDPINLAVQASDLPANVTKKTFLSGLDPSEVYYISSSNLKSVLSADKEYSSAISSKGVVVIKVTGDINFTNKFYSIDPDKRILFVAEGDVTFDDALGVTTDPPSGNGTDDDRIDVGIFTFDNINFPGSGEVSGDLTLVINGLLISGDTINFNRNRELENNHPGVAIHYDPAYVYYLQKQMRADPSYAEKIMSIVDISWDIKD